MRKKGSLSLSINAIVVLILAITILGLGLGFIKKQFGSMEKRFDNVDSEIQAQLMDEMQASGSLMTFRQSQFKVKSGSPYEFYFGVRNTENNPVCLYFQFVCDSQLSSGDGKCGSWATDANTWKWFDTFKYKRMEPQSSSVMYAKLQATGSSDTYSGRLIVWKVLADPSCPEDIGFLETGLDPDGSETQITEHDSKEFYITIE